MIRPNGPAAQSELQEGDEIVRVDGHDVTGENAYRYSALTRVKPGTTVTFDLKRGLSIKLVTTKL